MFFIRSVKCINIISLLNQIIIKYIYKSYFEYLTIILFTLLNLLFLEKFNFIIFEYLEDIYEFVSSCYKILNFWICVSIDNFFYKSNTCINVFLPYNIL